MKLIIRSVSRLRPVRFLLATLMCTMLFLMSSNPAQAAKTPRSQPTEGTIQLDKIMEKSEDAAHSAPMSLEKVEQRSSEGLNEVQGAADKNKMKSGNSQPVMVEKFDKAVDKVIKK
jgi:hypothetical protein